jgi:thiamine kinase-like enzyme
MPHIPIPQHLDDITPEWLTVVLRRQGMLSDKGSVQSVVFSDPGREASYAGHVSRLTLEYDTLTDGSPRTIIAKLPAPETTIRLLFRTLYRNEALFYRRIAREISLRVPACYAALMNRRRTRSLLLLEDLSEVARPGDHDTGCTTEEAGIALTQLARVHAKWWNSSGLTTIDWLGRYQVNSTKNWMIYAGAWVPFQTRLRHVTPKRTLQLVRSLWRYRTQLQELETGRPYTLQHGDFRLANLAFTTDDVYAFDWQVVRIGPPLFDVAWFMVTSLTTDQRRESETDLLTAYHVRLIEAGVSNYTMDDLMTDYRLSLLMTIPQMMVIGAFLRIDEEREAELKKLLYRFDAAREDHKLEEMVMRKRDSGPHPIK